MDAAAKFPWPTDNKFLNGPFTPWAEESEAYDLAVTGKIPDDLAGALFRIASNPRFQPRNLDRQPLARVELPARVPFGFHGSWAGAAVLDRAVAARHPAS